MGLSPGSQSGAAPQGGSMPGGIGGMLARMGYGNPQQGPPQPGGMGGMASQAMGGGPAQQGAPQPGGIGGMISGMMGGGPVQQQGAPQPPGMLGGMPPGQYQQHPMAPPQYSGSAARAQAMRMYRK